MGMVQQDNEDKKEYLNSYYYLTLEEKRISDRIGYLTSLLAGSAVQYSLAPKTPNPNRDLSDDFVAIEGEIERLHKKRRQAISRYREIENAIERVTDKNEQEILKARYLECMKWKDIVTRMSYTYQHILRLHGSALHHFSVPKSKDVIECD